MSQFLPEYPEMEIAIWLTSNATLNGVNHLVEGDIVAIREPHFVISDIEANVSLWLRVEGWEREMIGHLTDPLYDISQVDPLALIDPESEPIVVEKRRYCIPLPTLAQHIENFDLNRALDRFDDYQPAILHTRLAPDVRLYALPNAPLELDGLVFDKFTQEYLYA